MAVETAAADETSAPTHTGAPTLTKADAAALMWAARTVRGAAALGELQKGVIGVALANSPEFVAAAAGGKAVFGTNPVAFGIPQAGGPPLTFDMATSALALFGVLTSKVSPVSQARELGKSSTYVSEHKLGSRRAAPVHCTSSF